MAQGYNLLALHLYHNNNERIVSNTNFNSKRLRSRCQISIALKS